MNENHDAKVSERYRALGREEPGAALDAAILAAARRAAGARPGGAQSGWRRWRLPVSVAAVVVLSVTVTLQLQRERPDTVALYAPEPKKIEQSVAREAPREQEKVAKKDTAEPSIALGAGSASTPAATQAAPRVDEARAVPAPEARPRQFAPDPAVSAARTVAPSAAPAEAAADRAAAQSDAMRSRAEEATASAGRANEALPRRAPETPGLRAKAGEKEDAPERWLERIVELRAAGREREADDSFAEFRKRYPEYRISDELLGKLGAKR